MNEPDAAITPVTERPRAIPIPVQLLCLDEMHFKYAYLFDLQAEHGGIPVPVTGTVLRDCYNLRSAYFKEGEVIPTTPISDLAKFMKDLYAATIKHPLSTATKVATSTYPPAEALADLEVRLSVLAKLVRTGDKTVSRTLSALSDGVDKLVHAADSLATRIARLEARVEAGVGGRLASTYATGPCGTKNPHLHSAYCAHTVHPVNLKADQVVNHGLPSAGQHSSEGDPSLAGDELVTPTSVSERKRQWEDFVSNCSTLGNVSPTQFVPQACPAFPTPVPAPDGRSDATSTFSVRDCLPSLNELNAPTTAPWSGDMHQSRLPANFTAAPCCRPFNPIVAEKFLAAPTLPGSNRFGAPLPKAFEYIDDLHTSVLNLQDTILTLLLNNEEKEKATNDKVNKSASRVFGDSGNATASPSASTLHDTMRDVVTRLVVLETEKKDSDAKVEALTKKLELAVSHHLALEGLAKAVITNEIAVEGAAKKVAALADPKFQALADLSERVGAHALKLDAIESSLLAAQTELPNLSNIHSSGEETVDSITATARLNHLEEQITALATATSGPSTSDPEFRLNELAQKIDSLSTLVTQNAKIRDRLSSQHVESLEGIRESLGKSTNLISELDIKRDISVATMTKLLAKAETLDRGACVDVKGKKKADAEEQNTQHTSVATPPPAQGAQSTSIVQLQPIQAAPALPTASTAAQSNSNATPEVGPSLSGPLDMDGLVLSWRRNSQQQQEQRKTSKAEFKSTWGRFIAPVYSHPSTQGTSTRPGATMSPNTEVRPPLPKIPGSFPNASALNSL